MVRRFFYSIDIDPQFSTASESDVRSLKKKAMDEVLEEAFEKGDDDFLRLADSYVTGRDERKLEGMIDSVYVFSGSHSRPEEWLDNCKKAYEVTDEAGFSELEITKRFSEGLRNTFRDMAALYDDAIQIAQNVPSLEKYIDFFEAEAESIEELADCEDFESLRNRINALDFKRMPAIRNCEDPDSKALCADYRRIVKDEIKRLREDFFSTSAEDIIQDIAYVQKNAFELIGLVKKYGDKYYELKVERNIFDFSDIAHLALKILIDDDGKPSNCAKPASSRKR